MNRTILALFAGLVVFALLAVACGTPAPTPAPPSAPTLAPAPTVAGATETPLTIPTAVPTQGATNTPIVVATPSAPNTPSTTVNPTTAPTSQARATPGAGAACTNNATFVSDVTVPDGTQFAPSQQFNKTWRIRNSGTCAWTDGYTLVFVRGTNMAAGSVTVPPTNAGATVDLQLPMNAPTTPGSYTGFYRLRAPNGNQFGSTIWATIRVAGTPVAAPTVVPNFQTPSAGAACTNNSVFVADVTIPDNTPVTPGQQFTKTWRIRNAGTCAWDGGYTLAFERGTAMTSAASVPLPATAPGATVDVSVPLTAPTLAGTVTGFWRPKAPNGAFFGQAIWVIVRVGAGAAPSASPTP